MRFLGDMGIGLDVIKALREAGHDCTHLVEEGLERISDSTIMRKATDEERMRGRMISTPKHCGDAR